MKNYKNFPKKLDSYIIQERIGSGTYGVIYKVSLEEDKDNFYALKKIDLFLKNKYLDGEDEFYKKIKNEANLLQEINSKYVIKYYTSFEDNNYFNIITEYCSDGNLNDFIKKKKSSNEKIDEKVIWIIFLKILLGISEIHKNKIIHRDIKPLNIFIKNEEDIKIGDLGEGKLLLKNSVTDTTFLGTEYYKSPEQIENDENGNNKYSNKIDIWSLGITLYELCSFRNPFGFNKQQIFKNIKDDNYHYNPINEKYININNKDSLNDLNKIITLMLKKNPKERPSAKDLLNNEIIKKKLNEYKIETEKQELFNEDNKKLNNTQLIPEEFSEHYIDKIMENIPIVEEKEIGIINQDEFIRKVNSQKVTYASKLDEEFFYENQFQLKVQIVVLESNIELIKEELNQLVKNEDNFIFENLIDDIKKNKEKIDEFYNTLESYIDVHFNKENDKEKIRIKIIEIIFNVQQLLILKEYYYNGKL